MRLFPWPDGAVLLFNAIPVPPPRTGLVVGDLVTIVNGQACQTLQDFNALVKEVCVWVVWPL